MRTDVRRLLEVRADDGCRCLAGCLELLLGQEDPAATVAQVVTILERCLEEHPAGTYYRHRLRWR